MADSDSGFQRAFRAAGVPLLAGNVCHLSAEHSVCVVLERTRPLVFRPGSWVVVRVDRLLAGKAAGWFRLRAGASAPPTRARFPAPAQLLSQNALQGRGSGRVAISRSMISTMWRMVWVGSLGRRGRFRRR